MGRSRLLGGIAGVVALAVLQLTIAGYAIAAPLSSRPQIAITFDDAPLAVDPLLETLEQKGATATFFLVGQDAEANPSQAQAIASAGMLIGSHSYDHAHLATATAGAIRANLTLAQEAIEEQTGVTPRWYRSPYLDQNPLYDTVLPELGLTASWPTINPKDWSGPTPQRIIDLVLDQAAPGGVVILHDMDNRTNTIEALPGLDRRAAGSRLRPSDAGRHRPWRDRGHRDPERVSGRERSGGHRLRRGRCGDCDWLRRKGRLLPTRTTCARFVQGRGRGRRSHPRLLRRCGRARQRPADHCRSGPHDRRCGRDPRSAARGALERAFDGEVRREGDAEREADRRIRKQASGAMGRLSTSRQTA